MAKKDEPKADESSQAKQKAKAMSPVGRVVRYVIASGEERAAVIASVEDQESGICNLAVYKARPTDLVNAPGVIAGNGAMHAVALVGSVAYDAGGEVGTWHKDE